MPGANQFETTIVGGGVAGLTAALRLAERGVAVTVLEKGPLVGGNLSGVRHGHAYYDVYPHMFCEWYHNFWDLVEDLGLSRGEEFETRPVCGFLRAHDFPNYHRFTDYVQTLEEVRECHHLTGGDDFLLKVTTTNLSDLEALIEALLPYGNPVTSLVLSSPMEHRKYAVTGKLITVSKRPPSRRR